MRVFYAMNLGKWIFISPGVCLCAWCSVCDGVAWERIGCKWSRAFLCQQELEQVPMS